MEKTNKRNISIDLVKLIAIIGVVIIHSCDFSAPVASASWSFSLLWRTLSGAAVPLFLMSSGAVMLSSQKELPLKKLYFKNILRILIAMVFWGIAYKIYHLLQINALTFQSFINGVKEVLVFNQEFHFYYMHMMLIVYVFLPVTKIIINNASKNQLIYLLLLWFFFAIIYPGLRQFYPFNLFGGITTMWGINLTYASIGYGIMGYYLKKYPLSVFKSVVLIFAGIFSMFALTFYKSSQLGVLYEHYLAGNCICAFMLAGGIFSLALNIRINSPKAKWLISYLSKSSFCIYLVHMLVMYVLKENGINTNFAPNIISIPLFAFLVFGISLVFYFILSKIPFVKKWLV